MPRHHSKELAILALDQGTHASRALLFDNRGEVLCTYKIPVGLQHISPHRVEQDPHEILDSVTQVLQQAREYAQTRGLRIKTAGLCTQRSTVVAWNNKSGEALYPALSWQDTRGRRYLNRLRGDRDEIKSCTGLQISAHYGASKLRWLVENVPEVAQAAEHGKLCIGPLASFLLFHLLEGRRCVIDHGNAARTLLWNIWDCDWDLHLLENFAIDVLWLPQSLPIRADYGRLLDSKIPVSAVNGDQAAALFGHGALQPDTAVVNVGTGAFIMINTGSRAVIHPRLLNGITDSMGTKRQYALEGTVNGAGAALQWVKHSWGLDLSHHSETSESNDPPLFINTVGGLGSPWWKTGMTPEMLGLSPEDCVNAPARCLAAILESIVFMICANLQQILSKGISVRKLSIGGGLSRYDLLCQNLADLSALPVIRSDQSENTARGIAWLAANEPDTFPSISGDRFNPQPNTSLEKRYLRYVTLIDAL